MAIVGAHPRLKMLWKGGAGQLGRFVFLFTSMRACSFSPTSEFTGSSIEMKCKLVKKYKQASEKPTSEPVKSPLGVGRYSDMAVSPTRSHLLCMKALVVPRGYSWAFTIRPNDLREDRLPRDITEGIHWLVSTRYLYNYSLMRKKPEKLMSWPFYNPLWSFFGQLH